MLPLTPACPVCVETGRINTTRLLKCLACNAILYCGKEHQAANRPVHKIQCNAVKKARADESEEATKLRNYENGSGGKTNFFDLEYFGLFGCFPVTSRYMDARNLVAFSLAEIGGYSATAQLYSTLLGSLHLDRSDQMGLRYMLPFIGLRLGRNQEVYDFCEWYRRTESNWVEYDYFDNEFPFLDLKNADVFKRTENRDGGEYYFVHEIVMALLKFRLRQCLNDLQNTQIFSPRLPAEIIGLIKLQILRDCGLAGRKDLLREFDYSKRIMYMEQELDMHYKIVDEGNQYFWPMLFEKPEAPPTGADLMVEGEAAAAQDIMLDSYQAWLETPGAIDFMMQVKERNERQNASCDFMMD